MIEVEDCGPVPTFCFLCEPGALAFSIVGAVGRGPVCGLAPWVRAVSVVSKRDSCQLSLSVLHLGHAKGALPCGSLLFDDWTTPSQAQPCMRLGFCEGTSVIRTVLVGWIALWGRVMVVLDAFNTLSAAAMCDSVSIWMCEEFLQEP